MNRILIQDQQLARQIEFLVEIDRLKHVLRRTYLPGSDRRENSAEHSWHLALAALVLAEYADEPVDLTRVLPMLLVHDIVEIDAGDTFFYDLVGALDKAEREKLAADRIFGLLPPDQAAYLRALWDEFEERQTKEARFAGAIDRFMPLLHNYLTQGRPWRQHSVTGEQVMAMTDKIAPGSTAIAVFARQLVADAMEQGYFASPEDALRDA
jgi:putative hydrolase of HD superfamily